MVDVPSQPSAVAVVVVAAVAVIVLLGKNSLWPLLAIGLLGEGDGVFTLPNA